MIVIRATVILAALLLCQSALLAPQAAKAQSLRERAAWVVRVAAPSTGPACSLTTDDSAGRTVTWFAERRAETVEVQLVAPAWALTRAAGLPLRVDQRLRRVLPVEVSAQYGLVAPIDEATLEAMRQGYRLYLGDRGGRNVDLRGSRRALAALRQCTIKLRQQDTTDNVPRLAGASPDIVAGDDRAAPVDGRPTQPDELTADTLVPYTRGLTKTPLNFEP